MAPDPAAAAPMAEPPGGSARALPTGTVTFLFTDVEGSTRLAATLGPRWPALLERHMVIIRTAIAGAAGRVVSTEGDAFFAAFASPLDAVSAAAAAQRALHAEPWPADSPIRVRMGLHTGEGRLTTAGDDYAGLDVHRAARICAAGHGGQVLLSESTRALVARVLPEGLALRDLGRFLLKDLDAAEALTQLDIAGLAGEFPPLRTRREGRLPTPATSFIGRGRTVAEIIDQVDAHRLVTLTGPGGTGKTRLSIEVATRLADRFPGGAFFVALDALQEPELVASTVLQALEAADAPGATALERLTAWLSARELFLVLDNFEQVLAAAPVVDEMLRAAPGIRVLVTSRAPLRLHGEHEVPVPPLDLPDPAVPPTADALSGYEAIVLFVARARATRPTFVVTDENAHAVAGICRRLDGLPLAIELAAARVKLLTPEAILRRLTAALDLLATDAPNLPARQRTLRGAIGWSYDLLDERERRLMERLSVFGSDCDLDTAQIVCDPEAELAPDILDPLASLVDKSLVRQREVRAEPRFGMLETIRDFAREMAEARGQARIVRERMASWAADLAERAEPFLMRAEDEGWYQRLRLEHPNLLAALRWSVEAERPEPGIRIAAAVWRFWQREGLVVEGRWWVQRLAAIPTTGDQGLRVRARLASTTGSLAYWAGDASGAREAYREAHSLYEADGDAEGVARETLDLAFTYAMTGDYDAARALFEDALERARALGLEAVIQDALFMRGYTDLLVDRLDEAERALGEVLERLPPDSMRRQDAMIGVGQVRRKRGDLEGARQALRAGLSMLGETRDVGVTIGVAEVLGATEVELGDAAVGIRLIAAARGVRDRMGTGPPISLLLVGDAEGRARELLGDAAVEAALAAGRDVDVETLIDMALGRTGVARS